MPNTVSIGILFPTGPNVSVENPIYCNEGTITVGGYLGDVPAGSHCNVIAKVYSGTPYTRATMPAAPPRTWSRAGRTSSAVRARCTPPSR